MQDRLIDKITILILNSVLLLIFGESVTMLLVGDILFALIIIMSTEIFRNNAVALVAAAFSVLLVLLTDVQLIVPICVYAVLSTKSITEVIDHLIDYCDTYLLKNKIDGIRKQKIESVSVREILVLSINLIVAIVVILTVAFSAVTVVISLLAMVLSINTIRRDYNNLKIEKAYDKSRSEEYRAIKRNEELKYREEENIYMATLEERNRIAREIHDNVGHMLTRAIVQMQAIKVVNKDEQLGKLLDGADDTINQAMLNIRKSVHELHDDSIDISIMANELLRTLPESFTGELRTFIESPMSSELKNTILSIIKEALTNIAKYSKGKNVRIEIIEHTSFWRLLIEDDGVNERKEYDSLLRDGSSDGGIGLINICSRAKKIGGRVNIKSDENGFYILATLPK